MNDSEIVKILSDSLEEQGSKWTTVSIKHLEEATGEINARYRNGEITDEIYNEYISTLQSSAEGVLPGSRFIIVIATPQPLYRVGFTNNGRVHWFSIPPTYMHHTDREVEEIIKNILEPTGYGFAAADLPEKLVAVRSGLARYGRNNIAYIEGMGSFFRIRCYYTDLPGLTDNWQQAELMAFCDKCKACIAGCPTGALSQQRFLVQAGRCLTFFSETAVPWPHDIKNGWDLDNKCLVGCMKCQLNCPKNHGKKDWIEPVEIFTEQETRTLMDMTAHDRLPGQTSKKIARLYLTEYIPILSRNLNLLFQAASIPLR